MFPTSCIISILSDSSDVSFNDVNLPCSNSSRPSLPSSSIRPFGWTGKQCSREFTRCWNSTRKVGKAESEDSEEVNQSRFSWRQTILMKIILHISIIQNQWLFIVTGIQSVRCTIWSKRPVDTRLSSLCAEMTTEMSQVKIFFEIITPRKSKTGHSIPYSLSKSHYPTSPARVIWKEGRGGPSFLLLLFLNEFWARGLVFSFVLFSVPNQLVLLLFLPLLH